MPLVTLLDHILGPVGVYEGLRTVHDDNYVDRLSHYYTVIFLLFMQITVVTNEYVGDPIHCFCPTEFTYNEIDYTNYLCWVANTYQIPFSKPIPANYEVRRTDEITYYQWVPLILLLMAFLFKLPRNIWKYFAYTHSGIGLKRMLDLVKMTQGDTPEDRKKKLKTVAMFLDQWMTNVQRWTLQCVLPVNLYNEKFFIFLWFWITIVAVLTFFNVLYTVLLIVVPFNRKSFIKKYLKIIDAYDRENKDLFTQKLTRDFVDKYLHQDGIFLLKLITSNCNTVMVTDIVQELFDVYKKRQLNLETNGVAHFVHEQGEPNPRHHVTPRKGRTVHIREMPKAYLESLV
uniref:Innexin n=1 Tax=Magallana gigas TaxID=29159 RepID=A0A8W8KUN3_MAGGI